MPSSAIQPRLPVSTIPENEETLLPIGDDAPDNALTRNSYWAGNTCAGRLLNATRTTGMGALSSAISAVGGMAAGNGLGLLEGHGEAGLRRLQGADAQAVIASRGLAGLRFGAAALGLLGLSLGIARVANHGFIDRTTHRIAAVISGTAGAILSGLTFGYVCAAAGSIIGNSTARAIGVDPDALSLTGWDAGAMVGSGIGSILGGGGAFYALWPHRPRNERTQDE